MRTEKGIPTANVVQEFDVQGGYHVTVEKHKGFRTDWYTVEVQFEQNGPWYLSVYGFFSPDDQRRSLSIQADIPIAYIDQMMKAFEVCKAALEQLS